MSREIKKAVESFPAAIPNSLPLPDPTVVEAEWVQSYKAHRPQRWTFWLWAVCKLVFFGLVAWGLILLPAANLPTLLQNWKNPVIIFLLVCAIGKLMLDTFFYDHYQP